MRLKNKEALMGYDKELLEEWSRMPDWGDYLQKNGGLTNCTSQEGFDFLSGEYYTEVNRRIEYCKKLLRKYKEAFLYYVLAELYDRCNENEAATFLYKRPVKYCCLWALEIDPDFTPAKELLLRVDEWLDFIGGDQGGNTVPEFNIDF